MSQLSYSVLEYISQRILFDPLYFLVLGNKFFLPSFYFFRVYDNKVLFSSFYSLYFKYEHDVLYTLSSILQSLVLRILWLEHALYKIL